jgi:hypothetical protein
MVEGEAKSAGRWHDSTACYLLEMSLIGSVLGCFLNQVSLQAQFQSQQRRRRKVSLNFNKTRVDFIFSSSFTQLP